MIKLGSLAPRVYIDWQSLNLKSMKTVGEARQGFPRVDENTDFYEYDDRPHSEIPISLFRRDPLLWSTTAVIFPHAYRLSRLSDGASCAAAVLVVSDLWASLTLLRVVSLGSIESFHGDPHPYDACRLLLLSLKFGGLLRGLFLLAASVECT